MKQLELSTKRLHPTQLLQQLFLALKTPAHITELRWGKVPLWPRFKPLFCEISHCSLTQGQSSLIVDFPRNSCCTLSDGRQRSCGLRNTPIVSRAISQVQICQPLSQTSNQNLLLLLFLGLNIPLLSQTVQ